MRVQLRCNLYAENHLSMGVPFGRAEDKGESLFPKRILIESILSRMYQLCYCSMLYFFDED